jgi:16S rRNA processing protein RimM
MERLVVGRVRGVFGLRGAVRVELLTDDPAARFAVGSTVHREGDDAPLTIAWARADGPGFLVRFREVTTREEADELRDVYLEAGVTASLPDEEYYWHEVIGSQVRTTGGEDLGRVVDIFRTGGAEIYTVTGGPRGEVLVPAVKSVVRTFTPREGLIVVDPDALDLPPRRPQRPRGRRSSRLGAPAGEPVSRARATPVTDGEVDPGAQPTPRVDEPQQTGSGELAGPGAPSDG